MNNTHLRLGRVRRAAAVRNVHASGELELTLSKVTFYEECTVIEGAAYAKRLDTPSPTSIEGASVTYGSNPPIPSRSEIGDALGRLRQFTLSTAPGDESATTIRVQMENGSVDADLY